VASLDPADRVAVEPVLEGLAASRSARLDAAVAALDSPRYRMLLDRLDVAGRDPQVLQGAGRPASEVVPALAATAFARLRRAARRLGERPTDEELHALRIRAKQARYAVDVAAPVVGAPARRTARALARVQDVLGELHDCAVAERWLRDAASRTTADQAAFGLGWLAAGQRREAERLRAAWREAWRPVDRPKRTRWMRP
jgi:CHAD domain-containing protein